MARKDEDLSAWDQMSAAGNEAIDLINRVDDATAKIQPSRRRGSIIKSAQQNIFEFPVFVSNSIPLDYATATVSLLEQNYAAYLQMAISINPVVDAKTVKNGLQFANYKVDTNKYVEYTELDFQHDVCHNIIQEGNTQLEFELLSIEDSEARIINESVDHQPLSEFDHFFQEDTPSYQDLYDQTTAASDAYKNSNITPNLDNKKTTNGIQGYGVAPDFIANNNGEKLLPMPYIKNSTSGSKYVETKGTNSYYRDGSGEYIFVPQSLLRKYFADNHVSYGKTTGDKAFEAYRTAVDNAGFILNSPAGANEKIASNKLQNMSSLMSTRQKEIESIVERMKLGYQPSEEELSLVGGGDVDRGSAFLRSIQHGKVITDIGGIMSLVNSGMNIIKTGTDTAYNIATFKDRRMAQKYDTEKRRRELEDYDKLQALRKTEVYGKMKTSNIQYVDDEKCKKMNTMKPLLMKVTLSMLNKDDSIQPIEYVIGVKTHTRVIPSSILPEVAKYPLKEMDKISRKIKWRAGELKFLKDLVFRIDEKKQTAADARDPNRKWYRRLYELAHMKGDAPSTAVVQGKSIFKTFLKDKQGKGKLMHGFIPNAAIVMSQLDVNNIKQETDIDLLKASSAKKFCGELFLMNLIIIDTDAESIKIMQPDSNNDFDVQHIGAIKKQLATLDTAGTKTRDMFKLLG